MFGAVGDVVVGDRTNVVVSVIDVKNTDIKNVMFFLQWAV